MWVHSWLTETTRNISCTRQILALSAMTLRLKTLKIRKTLATLRRLQSINRDISFSSFFRKFRFRDTPALENAICPIFFYLLRQRSSKCKHRCTSEILYKATRPVRNTEDATYRHAHNPQRRCGILGYGKHGAEEAFSI